jgi:mitochondrial import inner membrane translocase subunit TIM54
MLARLIAEKIKAQRRLAAGLDQPRQWFMPIPTYRSPEETRRHELEGGSIVLGRQTFKEFMAGLKRGWTESLEKVDKEETLARELQNDGVFDEPEELAEDTSEHQQQKATPSFPKTSSPLYHPLQTMHPLSQRLDPPKPSIPSRLTNDLPPTTIPPQPPILFVPFTDYIGLKQIPHMLWDFFNQRLKVRDGAEAAYRLIMKSTRPFEGPDLFSTASSDNRDLSFDAGAEYYYKKEVSSTVSNIEKARENFYKELPAKLKVARDLSRRVREPTKDEVNNPPPTEVELRAERLKKELRWRDDVEGWEMVRPEAEVAWDERFQDALSVFVDPPSNTGDLS